MLRYRQSAWTRVWLSLSLLGTLLWRVPQLQAAELGPTSVVKDPYEDPDVLQLEYPSLSPANRLRIQPLVEPAPDEIPAGGLRTTVVFTIRNIDESYGGSGRPASVKLVPGDKFRINLANCSNTISHVYPVDTNLGGSFTIAADTS